MVINLINDIDKGWNSKPRLGVGEGWPRWCGWEIRGPSLVKECYFTLEDQEEILGELKFYVLPFYIALNPAKIKSRTMTM